MVGRRLWGVRGASGVVAREPSGEAATGGGATWASAAGLPGGGPGFGLPAGGPGLPAGGL